MTCGGWFEYGRVARSVPCMCADEMCIAAELYVSVVWHSVNIVPLSYIVTMALH